MTLLDKLILPYSSVTTISLKLFQRLPYRALPSSINARRVLRKGLQVLLQVFLLFPVWHTCQEIFGQYQNSYFIIVSRRLNTFFEGSSGFMINSDDGF